MDIWKNHIHEHNFMLWYHQSQFKSRNYDSLSSFSRRANLLEQQQQQTLNLVNMIRVENMYLNPSYLALDLIPLLQSPKFTEPNPMDMEFNIHCFLPIMTNKSNLNNIYESSLSSIGFHFVCDETKYTLILFGSIFLFCMINCGLM